MARKMSPVGNSAATAGSAAVAAWIATVYADAGGEIRFRVAVAELGFPKRIFFQRQPGHCDRSACIVLAEQAGAAEGADALGVVHPACLVGAALDRGLPVHGDAQLGERALDADRPSRAIHSIDVGRNAAGERYGFGRFVGTEQVHADQGSAEVGG